MNKLILCEGATDAILLSYYLGRTAGWKFCRKPPKNLTIKEDGIEESVNWYEKGDDRLLICGAGGKDRIKPFSEILTLIASYECGLAEMIKQQSEQLGHKLNNWELSDVNTDRLEHSAR
jgi:hypothetical protein